MILKSSSILLIFRLRQTANDHLEVRMARWADEDLGSPSLAGHSILAKTGDPAPQLRSSFVPYKDCVQRFCR